MENELLQMLMILIDTNKMQFINSQIKFNKNVYCYVETILLLQRIFEVMCFLIFSTERFEVWHYPSTYKSM